MNNSKTKGVSSVVGIILLLAFVVIISGIVLFYMGIIGPQSGQEQTTVNFEETFDTIRVTPQSYNNPIAIYEDGTQIGTIDNIRDTIEIDKRTDLNRITTRQLDNQQIIQSYEFQGFQGGFIIENMTAPDQVIEGDDVNVQATIINTDKQKTGNISFSVDKNPTGTFTEINRKERNLENGEKTTLNFEYTTDQNDPPEIRIEVRTKSDVEDKYIQVTDQGRFVVQNVESKYNKSELPIETTSTIPIEAKIKSFYESGTETKEVTMSRTQEFDFLTDDRDLLTNPYNLTSNNINNKNNIQLISANGKKTLQLVNSLQNEIESRFNNFTQQDTKDLTLAPNETKTITFDYNTTEGDANSILFRVQTDNSKGYTYELVKDLKQGFIVTSTSSNEPVNEGEELDLEAVVTNTGNTADTQDISLTADIDQDNAIERSLDVPGLNDVTLNHGEKIDISANIETELGMSPGIITHVSTEDDSESDNHRIDGNRTNTNKSKIIVNNVQTDKNVYNAGEAVLTTVDIENIGNAYGEDTIQLGIDYNQDGVIDIVRDSFQKEVNLGQGATQTLSFSVTADKQLAPEVDLIATTSENSRSKTIEIKETQAELVINNINFNTPVEEGNLITADMEVENIGNQTGESPGYLVLDIDGDNEIDREGEVQESVTLNPGETYTIQNISVQTYEGDAEEAQISPVTGVRGVGCAGLFGSDSAEAFCQLTSTTPPPQEEDPHFQSSITGPSTVSFEDMNESSKEVDLNMEIENIGNQTGTKTIELIREENNVWNETVTLDSNEVWTPPTSLKTSFDISPNDKPDELFRIRTPDDTDRHSININIVNGTPIESNFQSSITGPSTVSFEDMNESSKEVDLNMEVENIGNQTGTKTIELIDDKNNVWTETVTLDPNEVWTPPTSLKTSFEISPNDKPSRLFSLGTPDDTDRHSININIVTEPAYFEPSITGPSTVSFENINSSSKIIDMNMTVVNTGTETDTKTVSLFRDGNRVWAKQVRIQPGNTWTPPTSLKTSFEISPNDRPLTVFDLNTPEEYDRHNTSVKIGCCLHFLGLSADPNPIAPSTDNPLSITAEIRNDANSTINNPQILRHVDKDNDGNIESTKSTTVSSFSPGETRNVTLANYNVDASSYPVITLFTTSPRANNQVSEAVGIKTIPTVIKNIEVPTNPQKWDETAEVYITVENRAERELNRSIQLRVDNTLGPSYNTIDGSGYVPLSPDSEQELLRTWTVPESAKSYAQEVGDQKWSIDIQGASVRPDGNREDAMGSAISIDESGNGSDDDPGASGPGCISRNANAPLTVPQGQSSFQISGQVRVAGHSNCWNTSVYSVGTGSTLWDSGSPTSTSDGQSELIVLEDGETEGFKHSHNTVGSASQYIRWSADISAVSIEGDPVNPGDKPLGGAGFSGTVDIIPNCPSGTSWNPTTGVCEDPDPEPENNDSDGGNICIKNCGDNDDEVDVDPPEPPEEPK